MWGESKLRMDPEHERLEILEAIKYLASLIEDTYDSDKIAKYVEQLNELRTKLVALGPARKAAR